MRMPTDHDPSKWDRPPHTKAKHDMLTRYLDSWFPILSKWNGRVLFLDGFAGRGRYNDGAEGSPLIALRRLVEHRSFEGMRHREFVFFFVEADEENSESLRQELATFKVAHAPWPTNIHDHVINAPFDQTASGMIAQLREQKKNLAPTFAFVDPFGYSGLPMELLADLLAYPRSEVLVNFMLGFVQRFIEREGQETVMTELFGLDPADVMKDLGSGDDRSEYLKEVYVRQLQMRAGFDHVQSFTMRNSTGNISYCLFHGTRHRLGVKKMKEAMWRVDPGTGCNFSDRLAGHDVLFESAPDLAALTVALVGRFVGKGPIPIDEIEWFTLLETPYRETHVRAVLTPLEQSGRIRVVRPGRRGFPPGRSLVTFL